MTKQAAEYDGSTPLANTRHEAFCQHLVRGVSQAEAYRQAGYQHKVPASGAEILMRNYEVQRRAEFLRADAAKRNKRTVDDVLEDIQRRGQAAEDAEEYGPSLKASELEGKILGAFERDNAQRRPNVIVEVQTQA